MNHFKRTIKAYGGSVVAGLSSLLAAQLTGGEVDQSAFEAVHIGFKEIASAGFIALLAWAGVYVSPKNQVNA